MSTTAPPFISTTISGLPSARALEQLALVGRQVERRAVAAREAVDRERHLLALDVRAQADGRDHHVGLRHRCLQRGVEVGGDALLVQAGRDPADLGLEPQRAAPALLPQDDCSPKAFDDPTTRPALAQPPVWLVAALLERGPSPFIHSSCPDSGCSTLPKRSTRCGSPVARSSPLARFLSRSSLAAGGFQALERPLAGKLGLTSDRGSKTVTWRGGERFAYCSVFKWLLAAAVLEAVQRGKLALTERVMLPKQCPFDLH